MHLGYSGDQEGLPWSQDLGMIKDEKSEILNIFIVLYFLNHTSE